MVRDRTDNAPLPTTVARIDPVPRRGVAAVCGVREVVGPGGGRHEGLRFQQLPDLTGGIALQEAGGYECRCAVAEHAPAPGWGEEG
jgi:hypothetical protein